MIRGKTMLPILDHLRHLAEIDALELAEPYRAIASREWDGLANGKWHAAAKDAGCDPLDRDLRSYYLKVLANQCHKDADAFRASQN